MTGQHVIYDETAASSLGALISAAAAGQETAEITLPIAPGAPRLERDFAELTLIRTALAQNTPWARIGATLGMTGPQAKQHHKRLTARTRRAWYLQRNQED